MSTLKKYENILRVKNYSKNTIKTYSHYSGVFLSEFNKDVYHINNSEIKNFIESFMYSSVSQQNQIYSAVKLLFKYIVNKKLDNIFLDRPRREKKIPQIINRDVILNILNGIKNKKHRAILTLAYSCGLRRSEIINLKLSDFNKEEKIIYIRNAKGRKDRIVALSDYTRKVLSYYYREYVPENYLFNGQSKEQYSASSCNNIMKKYFGNDTHMHQLRHMYASHCLNAGVDSRTIQSTLGHSSIKTVEIYTHVSSKLIRQAVAC